MERRVSNPLVVRDLGLKRGDRIILDGVTFEVEPGELCALMGASGAGKSTILRAIAALEPFDAGTVMLDEAKLVPGPVPPQSRLKELRRHVGFVFQAPSLFEHMTALDNVMLALVHALRWPRDKSERVAAELLESLGVGGRSGAYPRELSGGEAQRVAIARALAPDPAVLLMDEPTAALDPARRGVLGELLRDLVKQGRALLVATHDVDFARSYADRVIELADRRIVAPGSSPSGV
jgi:ABC-type polar amino acid transport system ATPase subunit